LHYHPKIGKIISGNYGKMEHKKTPGFKEKLLGLFSNIAQKAELERFLLEKRLCEYMEQNRLLKRELSKAKEDLVSGYRNKVEDFERSGIAGLNRELERISAKLRKDAEYFSSFDQSVVPEIEGEIQRLRNILSGAQAEVLKKIEAHLAGLIEELFNRIKKAEKLEMERTAFAEAKIKQLETAEAQRQEAANRELSAIKESLYAAQLEKIAELQKKAVDQLNAEHEKIIREINAEGMLKFVDRGKEIAAITREISQLTEASAVLSEKISEQKRIRDALQETNITIKSRIEKQKQQIDEIAGKKQKLEQEKNEFENRNAELLSGNSLTLEEQKALDSQIKQLEDDYNSEMSHFERLQKRIKDFESEEALFNDKKKQFAAERDVIISVVGFRSEQIRNLKSEKMKLQEFYEKKLDEAREAEELLKREEVSINELREQSRQADKLNEDCNSIEKKIRALEDSVLQAKSDFMKIIAEKGAIAQEMQGKS